MSGIFTSSRIAAKSSSSRCRRASVPGLRKNQILPKPLQGRFREIRFSAGVVDQKDLNPVFDGTVGGDLSTHQVLIQLSKP